MMQDQKKAVIVGASSGIGREIAKQLLQRGWTVGVAARRQERLDELRQEHEGRVVAMSIDVTSHQATSSLQQLIAQLGGMDLYVHVAGIGHQNRLLDETVELTTADTNAIGFMRMVGQAYRYFAEKGCGHIAAITSIAGTKGLGPAPAYSATKALQNVYLQALEQQARQRGLDISVTDIRPGFVDTDLLAGDFHYPMMLRPERVASAVADAIDHRRHVLVVDWRYRLLTALWRRLPQWLWRRLKL